VSGLFFVLEGIDGSGKSTQVQRLAKWLRERGREVVATREPSDGPWGRRYRAWARGEVEADAAEVLDMFVRDRAEHVESEIRPALERGQIVVCDRYVASTLAYQVAHGNDRDRVHAVAGAPALVPDLTLWLRLPVELAIERMGESAVERYERPDFLERVDAEYARLGLVAVDASGDEERVAQRLREKVEPLL